MIRVGIMGGIGSGKTFVSKLFNCPIFNADKQVDSIYRYNKKCFRDLRKKLPIYIKSFPIKKSELINAISSNKQSLKIISSIVHPIGRRNMKKFLKEKKSSKIVVLDIPLLIENKLFKKDDVLVFVYSNKSKILNRLKKRKNYNKKVLQNLNQNQLGLLRKKKLANYIVDNNFTPSIMKKKIKILKKKILYERNCS